MSSLEARGPIPAASTAATERRESLIGTRLDYAAVAVVVLSLFFERLDRSLYLRGRSAIPDVTFNAALALLSLRYLHELVRGRVRLGRPTARETTAALFVVVVLVLGAAARLSLPGWMASASQVAKSSIHLAVLVYAAVLIGRAFSQELLEFALKIYFAVASAAAALAIVQAVDLNAGNGFLTRHLHLVYRFHPGGYEGPCSIFSEPAQLGYAMVAALVIGVLRWRSIGPRKTIAGAALCALAGLLAFPAGPALVALVLALILGIEHRARLKVSRRVWAGAGAFVVVLVAVAAATPVGPALYHRASGIVSGSDPSAQHRSALDRASVRIWRIAPATGVGIGDTRRLLPGLYHYNDPSLYRTPPQFNDSNGYLSLLGETGVVGLMAALAVLAAFIWPATRRPQQSTVAQLNTVGVAVSFFVAGSFLLPPLWFWGGLHLAEARAGGSPDRFRNAVSTLGRLLDVRSLLSRLQRPRLRIVVLVAMIVAAGAAGYAIRVQETSGRSVRLVRVAGTQELTAAPAPGDAVLARTDATLWAARYCGKNCHKSLSFLAGRLWRIKARWPNGTQCMLMDLASFRQISPTTLPEQTRTFAGLAIIPCSTS